MTKDNVEVVILAAGAGTRMGSDRPKALVEFSGKPFISHILEEIRPITEEPVIVVGYGADQIMEALGNKRRFAFQDKLLGTGHALLRAKSVIDLGKENIVVLYADMPLVKRGTVEKLIRLREETDSVISMATVKVDDFSDWRNTFGSYGKIIRNKNNEVVAIREAKDANPKEKQITEVNPAFFCFESEWLWKHIPLLETGNFKKEYYLTDLVGIACAQRGKIASFEIDPTEALGANTPEDLKVLENFT